MKIGNESPTAWDLAYFRDEEGVLTRLFGPGTRYLPVDVTIYNNKYQHMMTEEMTLGILLGIHGTHQIQLSLFGNNIYREDLTQKYLFCVGNHNYYAWITTMNIVSILPIFIQGIITGCESTN